MKTAENLSGKRLIIKLRGMKNNGMTDPFDILFHVLRAVEKLEYTVKIRAGRGEIESLFLRNLILTVYRPLLLF